MSDSRSATRKLTPMRRVVWKSLSFPEIIFGPDNVNLEVSQKTNKRQVFNDVVSTAMQRDRRYGFVGYCKCKNPLNSYDLNSNLTLCLIYTLCILPAIA